MKSGYLSAVWTFIGVTVGAGILGLPYVMQKAGFLTGLLVIFFVGIVMTLVTLYLGEIVLRTKTKHQLTGYASKYLGNKGKWLMFIANSLSIYGAMTAYTIGAGQAVSAVLHGNSVIYSLVFFVFFSSILYFGVNILSEAESFLSPLKIFVALLLGTILTQFINLNNLSEFNIHNFLIPYGVVVFALTGISSIPIIAEQLSDKRDMFKAIISGIVISIAIYVLFSFSIVGSLGNYVSEVATVSLSRFGSFANFSSNGFAFLAMATAFLGIGYALKENYSLDFKLKNSTSWFLTILFPLLIFLFNFVDFIKILEISGAVAIGIILILILIMHGHAVNRRERIPEYSMPNSLLLKVLIGIIFLIGIVYELVILLH